MDGNDVGMVAQSAHRPSFAADAGPGGIIQFLSLYQGKSHISVKERIMGEIDLLLAPLTEEFLDLVTAIGK
jgi:hypothetical protein